MDATGGHLGSGAAVSVAIGALGAPVLALGELSGPDAAYGLAVVLLGCVALGASGFRSALIIVPLRAWRLPLAPVVPLVLPIDASTPAWNARLNLPHVAWLELLALLSAVGAGVGLAVACALPPMGSVPWPLGLLGSYVLMVACRGLFFPKAVVARQGSRPRALADGTAAGWVEAGFGTSAPRSPCSPPGSTEARRGCGSRRPPFRCQLPERRCWPSAVWPHRGGSTSRCRSPRPPGCWAYAWANAWLLP